ncbi:MAG: tetratricopeptide repeat protein [Spirochaetales bacterium]|nr:tetratricopeptide repeat protein [Spirochaetales bacterium]
MIIPEKRGGFTRKRRIKLPPFIYIVLALIIVSAGLFFILQKQQRPGLNGGLGGSKEREQSIQELWEQRQYEDINDLCESVLAEQPMYYEALVFNGFSYFYRGAAMFSLEERIPLFDNAIINLRKARMHKKKDLLAKIEYILGKAYYQKGTYYTDVAIESLERSMDLGYTGEDTYEYLALSYSDLGDFQKSAEYYQKAIEKNPSDTLFMVLAQTYYKMDDIAKAEEYLHWTLNRTTDFTIEQKSRYLLGRIYLDQGEYLKAEDQYKRILEKNGKASDAHYYLGVISEEMKDTTMARYHWRKALEIDPYHYGARLKLYN